MVSDGSRTWRHSITYESLCCTPAANVAWCISYASIKKKNGSKVKDAAMNILEGKIKEVELYWICLFVVCF